MLCVVTEDTERVIGERRLATLRDLAAGARRRAHVAERRAVAARRGAGANRGDLPFALVYLLDDDGARGCSRRRRRSSRSRGRLAARRAADGPAAWPVAAGGRPTAGRRPRRAGSAPLPSGADRSRPAGRCVVPHRRGAGRTAPAGVLVVGLNPLPPARRRATAASSSWSAGQIAAGARRRARLRGRARAGRGAGRAGPRQDRRSSPTSATSSAPRSR